MNILTTGGMRPLFKTLARSLWRRALVPACGALLVLTTTLTQAQGWPNKPVRLIVPFPAGAAPDVVARLVGERLASLWGQAVVVDNRPGAGGIPGMSALVRSAGDGYTLGFVPAAVAALTPHLYKTPQFNLDSELQAVAHVGISPMMVAVSSASNLKSLADLVTHAKAQAGKLNFAAAQTNSLPHLTGEMLGRASGMSLATIPYNGSPGAITALLAGDVIMTVDGLPALTQHVRGGKLRALAVTSRERLPGFENVPAAAETLPGFESLGWFMIFAPAGVPAGVVEQVNRDVNKVLAQPDLVARFAEFGVYPKPGTPKDANDFLQAQRVIWKKAVTDMGLQPQ